MMMLSDFNSAFSMFIICLLFLFVCAATDLFVKKFIEKKYFGNIPVAPYFPFIGSAHLLTENFLLLFSELTKRMKNESYFIWFFHIIHYHTFDPEEIAVILNHPSTKEKAAAYKFFNNGFMDSLVCAKDKIWKKNRNRISRCYRIKQLEGFVQDFNDISKNLTEKFDYEEQYSTMMKKIERFFLFGFLATLCQFNFDEDIANKDKLHHFDLHEILETISNGAKRYLKPFYHFDFMYERTAEGKRFIEIHKTMDDFVQDIISSRKRIKQNDFQDAKERISLVNMVVEISTDIQYQLAELKFNAGAASETAASTLVPTLIILGAYQEIQNKIFQEVLNVVGQEAPIDHTHLHDLKYTENVIMETLRLFPPAPIIGRETTQDLHIGQKVIPKGTQILINIFELHRNDKYWEEPAKFNPNRFLLEESKKRPLCSFIPFSAGPRNCIGKQYAIMFMKIALANIVRKYQISSNLKSLDNFKLGSFVILKVLNSDDFCCSFIPRIDN